MPDGQNGGLDYFGFDVTPIDPGPIGGLQYERPSYVLNNLKWGSPTPGTSGGTIRWAFVTASSGALPSNHTYSSSYLPIDSPFVSTLRAAFDRWEAVGNFDFVEVTSLASANIIVAFDELSPVGANTIGLAEYFYSGSSFVRSYVSFDINRRYRLQDGSIQTVGTSSGNALDFYTLALHEIGHSIGLGHEDSLSAVMGSIQSGVLTDLTSDDIAGVRAIYGSPSTTPTVDDYPASTATQANITVGGTATGRIDSSTDEDWFRVTLTAGTVYRIDLRGYDSGGGTLLDPYLRLLNSSLTQLAADDDSGTGTDSQLLYSITTTGVYYIAASGFDGEQGTYTIAVSTTTTADDYPASSTTTGALTVGGSATGRLETSTDADWFAVTLTVGQSYRVDLRGSASGGGTLADPFVRVRSSSGVIYAFDNDSGVGADAQLTYTAGFTGVHYIEAATQGSGTGTYTVSVSNVTPAPDDYAASTATTGAITVGGSATGSIENAGDRDWFRVNLAAGTTYRFDVRGSVSSGGTLADPYLTLRDANGNQLAFDDDSGPGLDAQLSYAVTVNAIYYLEARSASTTATGTYTVAVTATAPPDDYGSTTSTAGSLNVGATATGNIGQADDVDWLRVTLTAGTLYRFDGRGAASGGGTLSDPIMSLLNSSGTAIVTDNNSGEGADARILYRPGASGTFYLSMRSTSATATGTYSITATANPDDYAASTATTGAVTVGGTATGIVETAGDRDWFRTTLTAGTAYDIDVRPTAAGSGIRWIQSSLVLRDSTGAQVASNTENGLGAAARLNFRPTASGTYYIDALAYAAGVGSYSVSVATSALETPAITADTERAGSPVPSELDAITALPAFDLGDYTAAAMASVPHPPRSPFAELLAAPDLVDEDRHRLEASVRIEQLFLARENPFGLPPLG